LFARRDVGEGMAIWTPVDRQTTAGLVLGATSADFQVECSGSDISGGEIAGVSVTADTGVGAGAGHAAIIKLYSEAGKTNLFYETTIDLTGADVSGTDMLATPIPVIGTPTYTVTDVDGNGSNTYAVLFFVRTID
jgi:hypothetical protein